jgi:serine protease Do
MKKTGLIAGLSFFIGAIFFALSFGYLKNNPDPVITHDTVLAKSSPTPLQAVESTEKFTGVSLAPIVKMVKPAVVKIDVKAEVDNSFRDSQLEDEFFKRFFGQPRSGKRRIPKSGSGFLISKDGYIVTNNHVVKDAVNVTVVLSNNKEYKAKIIGTDPQTDLALIKIKGDSFPFITFGDSDKTQVGDFVLAIGNPLSQNLTVTSGIISAKNRYLPGLQDVNYQNYLQTDAAINQGNSGGPLVNIQGRAIGINSVILSGTGGNIGLGFSIPSNMAKKVIKSLRERGTVIRGYLGVGLQYFSANQGEEYFHVKSSGAIIRQVATGTPAEKAGLKTYDYITEINNHPVNRKNLPNIIADTPPGENIILTIYRKKGSKNMRIVFNVKVGTTPGNNKDVKENLKEQQLGLELKNNSPSFANQYDLPTAKGIVVLHVAPNSNAAQNLLKRGDIIINVSRTDVKNVKHFFKIISSIKRGSKILMEINRNGQNFLFPYTLPE